MSLNFCDLFVLGSDLSGVIAGTLLAKRGMNVLVIDDESEEDVSPNVLTGLGSRAFKSLLGKLMIPESKLQAIHENPVSCQIIFPKHRLDLSTSRTIFLKEIEREFPQEKDTITELLGEVDRLREGYLEELLSFFPITGSKEKKAFTRWLHRFPWEKVHQIWVTLSPTVKACIRAQLRFASRNPLTEGDPPLIQLLLFFPPEQDASFTIRGGLREIKKIFFDKLDYFGGMVHPLGDDPYQILAKGREIRAVQLERYHFQTRCRYLLGNTNIQALYKKLPSSVFLLPFHFIRKKMSSLTPEENRGTLEYQIAAEVIPSPMKENVIFIANPEAPLEGTNYLEINLSPLPKNARQEGSHLDTLMTVSYPITGELLQQEHWETPALKSLHQEIDQRIRKLVPFAEERVKLVFPHANGNGSQDSQELFPMNDDFTLFEKRARRQTLFTSDLFFPSLTTPFKNLFVTGPNVLPWLGTEGKLLSALKAVDLIWTMEMKARKT